ncbi:MAG: hypothetical protein DRP09_14905 [Candidatus Thorarchaeota archaeon]|nr:MAG: hypothetical protein DRP09_14905 [Candidatus Thorarchaeota archaeon]
MQPTVVRVDPERLELLRERILSEGKATTVRPASGYEAFRFRYQDEHIVAYRSGKIVSSGPRSAAVVAQAVRGLAMQDADPGIVIGSDEAGKGEWLGPLVVAAVALTPEQSAHLQAIGVMDSKEVPLSKIPHLARDILETCIAHQTVLIPPATFNERLTEMRAEGKNLNDLLAWAHARAISDLISSLPKSQFEGLRVVIDEFARGKTQSRLRRVVDLKRVTVVQKPHAEDVIAVAAASIVAREAREAWIDRAGARLGIDLRELTVTDVSRRKDCSSLAKAEYVSKMTE